MVSEKNNEYIYIITCALREKAVVEKLPTLPFDLSYTNIRQLNCNTLLANYYPYYLFYFFNN